MRRIYLRKKKRTIDLTDPEIIKKLDTYKSKISMGEGADILL